MNRRIFIRSLGAFFALLFLSFTTILTGCPSTTTIAEFISLIGKDAASLATYFNQTSLATQILSLSSQIAVDVTNWQSGSPATLAIHAIQDLMNLIGTIPIVSAYAPLVDLLLSALSGLLLLLPGASGAAVPHAISGRAVVPTHYPDATPKSMSAAKKNFTLQWTTLTKTAPLQ